MKFTAAYNEAVSITTVYAALVFKLEKVTVTFSPGNQITTMTFNEMLKESLGKYTVYVSGHHN